MDFIRLVSCEPPLAQLWQFESTFSYEHVQDLLEVLEVREEFAEIARKQQEAKIKASQQENQAPRKRR